MNKLLSHKRVSQLILLGLLSVSIIVIAVLSGRWGTKTEGAGTNISSNAPEHWAWNENIGWIDFYTPNTVFVSNTGISGYASSSLGQISLDCATSSNGNICGTSNYTIANNGAGKLSGYAWNDTIGWISFCNNMPECPGSGPTYQVTINGGTGEFSGYAWNDNVGWISFNCINTASCGTSNYKVITSWRSSGASGWLESTTYDTGVTGGAQINSILWRGNLPIGAAVRFQMAFSNSSSGPWVFGWDSVSTSSPATNPDTATPIDYTLGANQRYFRYRTYLYSDPARTASPRIDEVIVNWSR